MSSSLGERGVLQKKGVGEIDKLDNNKISWIRGKKSKYFVRNVYWVESWGDP